MILCTIDRALDSFRDHGLLIMRLGLGILFLYPGWMMISHPEGWEGIGMAMGNLGISFAPKFWGFMASLTEFGGAFLLIIGLAFRPATLLLAFTMLVAFLLHRSLGDDMQKMMPSIICMIVFVSLFFIGPGRFSVDAKLNK
jgi:putative oxidoreductase